MFSCGDIQLHCGDYRDVLADVECDALICDPPYGERTHNGQRHGRKDARYCDTNERPLLSSRGLTYATWTDGDVSAFVEFWHQRTRGWFVAFSSHDLAPVYAEALRAAGRYVFAPIACVQHAMNVRLAGDGPSNWTTWLTVSRPRGMKGWGALPGAYTGANFDPGENSLDRSIRPVAGGKPVWLMRAIVRDYSRPGDLVCDPCAGGATTLIAAALEGRRAVGSEMDPETYAKAMTRIQHGNAGLRSPNQVPLFEEKP